MLPQYAPYPSAAKYRLPSLGTSMIPRTRLVLVHQRQRDRVQRDALDEVRRAVDRVEHPVQPVLARGGAAFLFAQESDLRVLFMQVTADSLLDRDVNVGHHVAVAFSADDRGKSLTDDLTRDIHRVDGNRQEPGRCCHTVLARVHNPETMASNMGSRPWVVPPTAQHERRRIDAVQPW